MFDHLQVSTITGTLLPSTTVPCTPSQDHPVSTCSYAIGSLAPEQITRMETPLPDGEVCPLLVPVAVPRSILDHPAFREGSQWCDLSHEEREEPAAWTSSVPRLVNFIYTSLGNAHCSDEAEDDFPCAVGWLLRDLTRLAQQDATLAAVGMAHLCFSLSLFPQPRPATWPLCKWYDAYCLHEHAIKAYRARVRLYREQGKRYEEAQQLALAGSVQ